MLRGIKPYKGQYGRMRLAPEERQEEKTHLPVRSLDAVSSSASVKGSMMRSASARLLLPCCVHERCGFLPKSGNMLFTYVPRNFWLKILLNPYCVKERCCCLVKTANMVLHTDTSCVLHGLILFHCARVWVRSRRSVHSCPGACEVIIRRRSQRHPACTAFEWRSRLEPVDESRPETAKSLGKSKRRPTTSWRMLNSMWMHTETRMQFFVRAEDVLRQATINVSPFT